ncbi:hypothetical protein [Asaia sp. As-1742]|uniref:hypothetical protein n=1 Tax=Asaia sp. As-1742 TaxID=2608325 RepID=UPI00141DF3C5|nr:hypothetical protein [Asaia sp. As-1742]NIE81420.1 hypothetical protein [Asaia sp. As-1742]
MSTVIDLEAGIDLLLRNQRGQWTHSPIYRFFEEHFDRLNAGWTGKCVRWQPYAEIIERMGLRRIDGGIASPTLVKRTWYRVREAMKAAQEARIRAEEEAELDKLRRKEARKAAQEAIGDIVRQGTRLQDVALKPHEIGRPDPSDRFQGRRPVYSPEVLRASAPPAYPMPEPARPMKTDHTASLAPTASGGKGERHPFAHPDDPTIYFRRKRQPKVELMADPTPEELERSDMGWPGQLPRELWGDVKIITQAWCDATEKDHRDWRLGPDRFDVPGMEALPLKMTFTDERDWLRCWRYLFLQRQRNFPGRAPDSEQRMLMAAWYSAGLESDRMESRLKKMEEEGKKLPALWIGQG